MAQTSDVFKLLKDMKEITPEKVKAASTSQLERVSAEIEPATELIHPYEPGYIDEFEYKTYGGHTITVDNIWDAFVRGENIRFTGPSGCGKSALASHILDRANESIRKRNRDKLKVNVERKMKDGDKARLEDYENIQYKRVLYTCDEGTRTEDIIGDVTIMFTETGERKPVVVPGCLTKAYTQGYTLIFEEDDICPPGVLGAAHPFLDGRSNSVNVFLNGMSTLKKNDLFRVIATSNTLGSGENVTEFAGTQIQNTAYLNRYTYVVKASWLKPESEINLLFNKAEGKVNKDLIRKAVECSSNIRGEYDEEKIQAVVTTRDLLSWVREVVDEQRRQGKKATLREWANIAVPAMYPTFLNRIADEMSRQTVERYLSIL